jgi:hypothetical protein
MVLMGVVLCLGAPAVVGVAGGAVPGVESDAPVLPADPASLTFLRASSLVVMLEGVVVGAVVTGFVGFVVEGLLIWVVGTWVVGKVTVGKEDVTLGVAKPDGTGLLPVAGVCLGAGMPVSSAVGINVEAGNMC